jgi:methyl-accepting chemotaxis protein
MPQGTSAPLKRIQRHVLWLVVAFFIALSYFAVRNLGEKYVDRENARLIHAWTETSIAFSQLIHELQKERGMSSGFIASSGEKFTVELPEQRLRTDQAAAQLTARMEALLPSAKKLADLSRTVLEETGDLPELRRRIDTQTLSREYAVDQYSLKIW